MNGGIHRVSVHGGHSGEFCNHARDRLADVVQAYADQGFAWVGITEHMPPVHDRFLYPDERAAGLDAAAMQRRFGRYMDEVRRLQREWRGRLPLLAAFETEACSGAFDLARRLVARYRPDYIVGSVHHVADIPFDLSADHYEAAVSASGGCERFYLAYFDRQLEMIETLRPQVVGHFDLARIFDPDYGRRLALDSVRRHMVRNLERIREIGAILDFNLAALDKGADEPYLAAPVRRLAREMGIAVVPGDDSHGVATVGRHIERGIRMLREEGFPADWPMPGKNG